MTMLTASVTAHIHHRICSQKETIIYFLSNSL